MNPTFNSGIDYFGLESTTSNALKATSSNENRSKQSASGANSYGDAAVVDSWGETAAPSTEYLVVGAITAASFTLGGVTAAGNGMANPERRRAAAHLHASAHLALAAPSRAGLPRSLHDQEGRERGQPDHGLRP